MAVQAKVAFLCCDDDAADRFIAEWAHREDRRPDREMYRPQVGQRSLAGRALLRFLLAKEYGNPSKSWVFKRDAQGKPEVIAPPECTRPGISISHSGTLVCAALTPRGDIGIDIERRRPRPSIPAIARTAFGPREAAEAIVSDEAFYRIWSLREALAKASGAGLQEVADRQDRVAGAPKQGAWSVFLRGYWQYLACRTVKDEYSLAIAVRVTGGTVKELWSEESIEISYP